MKKQKSANTEAENVWIEGVSAFAVPAVIGAVGALMLSGRKNYFESFLTGAKRGLDTAVRLLPTLVALLVAIRMLSASGAVELLCRVLAPFFDRIGVPAELLPLLLTRPFSGSAATAAYSDLIARLGADSFPPLCASVIMGSSDTVVYIVGVYLSYVNAKKSRYAYPLAFTVMLFCVFLSCLVCRLWFKI